MDRLRRLVPPAALTLLTLGALGCASGQAASDVSQARTGTAADATDAPLEAWFDSEPRARATRASFHLSRPAYVAVFELLPGDRIRALYPSRPLPADAQHRFAAGGNVQDWTSHDSFAGSGLPWERPCPPARYWLLVASERPLDFGALGRDVAFRSRPGSGVARVSYQPHRAFETVVERLLPDSSGAWDMTAVETRRRCT